MYVNQSYIFATLREAAKYTKCGRGSIQPKITATLQVLTNRIYFNRYMPAEISRDENELVYLDIRGVKNPNTKGRNVRYRVALKPGWEAEFEILWDNTLVTSSQIEAVLYDGGTIVGLAYGRNIGFGRFDVISIETISYEDYKSGIA
ncbi:hypothetical protein [Bacillus massilinigeriensis]|uniref:hypothetical protein n=1 Tax=Bacillus mediterraneensis TaxID=1805474 RepID=UPI0009F4D8B0|nr:hypothetical protein [Bacillus mediterraneensis]